MLNPAVVFPQLVVLLRTECTIKYLKDSVMKIRSSQVSVEHIYLEIYQAFKTFPLILIIVSSTVTLS